MIEIGAMKLMITKTVNLESEELIMIGILVILAMKSKMMEITMIYDLVNIFSMFEWIYIYLLSLSSVYINYIHTGALKQHMEYEKWIEWLISIGDISINASVTKLCSTN